MSKICYYATMDKNSSNDEIDYEHLFSAYHYLKHATSCWEHEPSVAELFQVIKDSDIVLKRLGRRFFSDTMKHYAVMRILFPAKNTDAL